MTPDAIARALLLAAALVCLSLWCTAVPAATPANILVILADDMGYSDNSPYGSEIFTPNIARLANQGMMLTNFHVAAYCAPTRSMLLTGVDNHLVGLGNMIEPAADNQRGKPEGYLNGRAATLATILHNAGYHTYMSGKWHLGKTPASIPAAQGFEQSVGVLEGGADNWENKSCSPGYKSVHFFDRRKPITLPPDFYSSNFYADKMIGYIDQNADVVPTLLDLAGVSPPHNGSAPLGGRSMVALLARKAKLVHPPEESIGYEARRGGAVPG